jgi:signal transduction histidine kinase
VADSPERDRRDDERRSVARLFNTTLIVFVASLFLMAGGGVLVRYVVNDANARVVDHWIPIERAHGRMLQQMTAAESSLRGYHLTLDRALLQPFVDARDEYPARAAAVVEMIGDDDELAAIIGEEAAAADVWFSEWGSTVLASTLTEDDPRDFDRTTGVEQFATMVDAHSRATGVIALRIDDSRDRARFVGEASAVVMVGYVVAVIVAGWLIVRRLRREVVHPLGELRVALNRLERQDLSARVDVTGATEVRQLGEAVNQLAEFSQRATVEQQARTESNRVVRAMASSIHEHLESSKLVSVTVETLGPALGGDHAIVIRVSPDRHGEEVIGEWRRHDGIESRLGTVIPNPDELTELVTRTFLGGKVVAIDDVAGDESLHPAVVEHLTGLGVCSLMLAPIAVGDEISGVLSVSTFDAPRRWTAEQQSMVLTVGVELARALRLADLYERERDMVNQLRSLDQAKTDFISSVSHELRTPLTSILGYTELLVDGDVGPLEGNQQSMMVVIDRNARRLLMLIDDLLMMSQIDANRLTISRTSIRIRRLLDGIADTMRPLADAAGLSLTIAPVGAEATVWADERALERVLLNLVSNAIKFTPPGGSVSVTAEPADDGVRVTVSDTGVGIPADEQDQLFTRFFRSSASRANAVQGTGLGLAIVRHIVEAHHGTVGVISELGHGTDVSFMVPPPPPSDEPLAAGAKSAVSLTSQETAP